MIVGGLGGVGKTQLTIAYARQFYQSYDSVFWLNASSEPSLQASLCLLAGRVIKTEDQEELNDAWKLTRVHDWLSNSKNSRWLLIFDNYDTPLQYDIKKYCPYAGHGSIIITTRVSDQVRVGARQLRLHPLQDMNECLQILQSRSQRDSTLSG